MIELIGAPLAIGLAFLVLGGLINVCAPRQQVGTWYRTRRRNPGIPFQIVGIAILLIVFACLLLTPLVGFWLAVITVQ